MIVFARYFTELIYSRILYPFRIAFGFDEDVCFVSFDEYAPQSMSEAAALIP